MDLRRSPVILLLNSLKTILLLLDYLKECPRWNETLIAGVTTFSCACVQVQCLTWWWCIHFCYVALCSKGYHVESLIMGLSFFSTYTEITAKSRTKRIERAIICGLRDVEGVMFSLRKVVKEMKSLCKSAISKLNTTLVVMMSKSSNVHYEEICMPTHRLELWVCARAVLDFVHGCPCNLRFFLVGNCSVKMWAQVTVSCDASKLVLIAHLVQKVPSEAVRGHLRLCFKLDVIRCHSKIPWETCSDLEHC